MKPFASSFTTAAPRNKHKYKQNDLLIFIVDLTGFKNHHGNILLGLFMRMLMEKFSWYGKTIPNSCSTIPWAEAGPKQKRKMWAEHPYSPPSCSQTYRCRVISHLILFPPCTAAPHHEPCLPHYDGLCPTFPQTVNPSFFKLLLVSYFCSQQRETNKWVLIIIIDTFKVKVPNDILNLLYK